MSNFIKNYIEYDTVGRIIATCKLSDLMYVTNKATKNLIEGSGGPETHYVDLGSHLVKGRPHQQTAYYKHKLLRLPVPCTIYINETAYPCSDVSAELELERGKSYQVRVDAFPYVDWETTIEN